jgi:hypothetical protein
MKALILAGVLLFSSAATAQTEQTTDNLITSGATHTWSGISTTGALPTNAMPGGPGALYDPNTNTIHFSYGQATVAQTIAINQALTNSGSGIQVQGYTYSWEINNLNYDNRQGGTDTLTARVITYTPTGDIRRNDGWTYNTKFDWTTFSGTVNYVTPGAPSEFGNLRVEFSGVDSGFWGGYFGPQVRNVDVRLRYTAVPVDPCVSDPQSSPSCPGYRTYYNIGDDGYAIIPLPFGYPLYGRTFTHSVMFDNGVVSFYDPLTEDARLGGQEYWAETLSNNIGNQFYYSIMPLWTDLRPNTSTKLYTQTDSINYLKYTWEDIQQYGYSDRPNMFSLEIRPSGYLGIQYDKINIDGYPITAGAVGNAALGEWTQTFHGSQAVTGTVANWNLSYTQPTDCSNPLNNSACPGYADAYYEQQCAANPLYSTSCAGYATAFHNQQCAANALYATTCPGYQQAYYDQQCGLDPLYDSQCPGYQATYYDQQCSVDALYDTGCPGYQQAYFDQQCTANPLYSNSCPGYATAFFDQQCAANPLYSNSCPGYQQAYYNQQCSINPLYDSGCPNHSIVLAATQPPTMQESVTTVPAQAVISTAEPDTTSPTSVSPASVISVIKPPAAPVAPAPSARSAAREAAQAAARAAEQKAEAKKTERAVGRAVAKTTSSQAAQEAADASSSATTIEAQQAAQNLVLGLMGFNPAFSAYQNAMVPDVNAAVMGRQYNQPTQDNQRALRQLSGASDRIHQDMVDQQYGRMP